MVPWGKSEECRELYARRESFSVIARCRKMPQPSKIARERRVLGRAAGGMFSFCIEFRLQSSCPVFYAVPTSRKLEAARNSIRARMQRQNLDCMALEAKRGAA